ncbi:GNAT family N-acetyltransferase [Winogradskyella sp.]|uniref:GNAT family N-acetyltransferase n=1 Tax=Winogradskyella sp. TaxID=1883156 RepID=UPI003F6B587C
MNTVLETPHLILRPVILGDIDDFFELDSNPNVHKFLGNNPVKTIDQSKEMINDILKQYGEFGMGRLAIIKKDTKEFIGWSGIKYEQNLRKAFNYYDLGYRLKEQFWNKGFATEAALASLDHGFNTLKLKKICAAAGINHIASNSILKKIGMQPNGTFEFEGDLCNWYIIKNPNI